jgi:hypothetical protein
MVEFSIRLHQKQRLAYIPQELAKMLGANIKASANCVAVLMYPEGTKPEDVLRSLDIIAMDLKQKIDLQKRRASANPHLSERDEIER